MSAVGGHHELAFGLGLDAVLLHQATYALLANPHTPGEQFLVHARPALLAFDLGMNGTHVRKQGLIAVAPKRPRAFGFTPAQPTEVPAGAHLQHLTGNAYWPFVSHLVNPGVPRSVS